MIVNFEDFEKAEWSKSKAYILGLIYPKLNIVKIEGSDKLYISGLVSHNSNQVLGSDLAKHFMSVNNLLSEDSYDTKKILKNLKYIRVYSEKTNKFRKTGKKGFGINLQIDYDIDEIDKINDKLNVIFNKMPEKYLDYFVAATIDGRSSYDNSNKIALDIDRDYKKQEYLVKKLKEGNYDININQRAVWHKNDDQLRYNKESLGNLAKTLPLMSISRRNILMD